MSRIVLLALAVTVAAATAPASAQGFRLAAEVAEGSRRSDLEQLRGARLEFLQRVRAEGVELRYGVTALTRGGESIGTPCMFNFVRPETCPDEPIDERRLLAFGSFGVGVHAHSQLLGFSLYADVLGGAGRIVDRGTVSNQQTRANRVLLGVDIGSELRLAPATSRWQVFGGAASAGITPFVLSCADCWMPFGGNFSLTRFYLGVGIK